MRSLILATGLLLVASAGSAASGDARATADSVLGSVPELAILQPRLLASAPAVALLDAPIDGQIESGASVTAALRNFRHCPTRKLKGRYNRCR